MTTEQSKPVTWGTIRLDMLAWHERKVAQAQAIATLEGLATQKTITPAQITAVLNLLKGEAA